MRWAGSFWFWTTYLTSFMVSWTNVKHSITAFLSQQLCGCPIISLHWEDTLSPAFMHSFPNRLYFLIHLYILTTYTVPLTAAHWRQASSNKLNVWIHGIAGNKVRNCLWPWVALWQIQKPKSIPKIILWFHLSHETRKSDTMCQELKYSTVHILN